uniref:Uncharacterized protein n=1 Tax=virus sp. ctJpG3 TaxID=2825812 RepID=A0A8S5RNB7_9VIRU|nr:MAG TPA: hypothetical protein [virus sp. ctJpG3]
MLPFYRFLVTETLRFQIFFRNFAAEIKTLRL